MKKSFRYGLGWFFVRPRRWLFWRMVGSCYVRWLPEHDDYFGWKMPNVHWWILYITVFKFFCWLHYDAWRPLCTWKDGWLHHTPCYAEWIQRIGQTTAGSAISGGECFHCASKDGNQVDLADDETGMTFILTDSGTTGTQDGTDHWFCGITICPRCGFRSDYRDSSL